ncbi:MAG: hypothetical protein L3J24_02435 [Xanthomonadales bacterium]|nr:hypothetical protein [Xanthomonadales bacterium]
MELDAQVLQNELDALRLQSIISKGVITINKKSSAGKQQYQVNNKTFADHAQAQEYLEQMEKTIEQLNEHSVDCIREMMGVNKSLEQKATLETPSNQ